MKIYKCPNPNCGNVFSEKILNNDKECPTCGEKMKFIGKRKV